MITEEALPTYMAMLNTLDGVRDETGAAPTPWAQWTRLWTAEENRHGDLMSKYIYLTGRCAAAAAAASQGCQPGCRVCPCQSWPLCETVLLDRHSWGHLITWGVCGCPSAV